MATTEKLFFALDRMLHGKTVHLTAPFDISNQNLAREAGVDESTLYRKKDGKYIYADVLAAVKCGMPPTKKETHRHLRARNAALEEKVVKLQDQIALLSQQLRGLEKKTA